MKTPPPNTPPTLPSPVDMKDFIVKWTPRLIVAGFAGYYSLGVAYEYGLMANIDKVAIRLLKNWVGYAGIGAAMPSFQWYASLGVRLTAAGGAGILYDLVEKIVRYFINKVRPTPNQITNRVCFQSLLLA